MITLYGYGEKIGVTDPSPFVLKIHTYLRMSGLAYNTHNHLKNLQKAPKGKLPFIIDNPKNKNPKKINRKGKLIADSAFIIDYLKQTYTGTENFKDIDAWLLPEQIANNYLISKSLDENFYFCLVYARWVDDAGWSNVEDAFFGDIPNPFKKAIIKIARRKAINQAKAQGMGRHSKAEIEIIANNSIEAIATLLGNKDFIIGDQPCSLDATIYGFLAQTISCTADFFWAKHAKKHQNLVDYCQRIETIYFNA